MDQATQVDAAIIPPSGRVALVTGAARGIGLGIVSALVSDGFRVIGADLLEPDDPLPFATFYDGVDLGTSAGCQQLIEAVDGTVDVLVNNAGLLIHKPLEDFTIEEFDRTIAVNQRAPLWLARSLLPGMRERGWGRVVNISSVGARTGGVSQSGVYNGTKAAMLAMTKFLARNYGHGGVTVNAVAPGAVETAMMSHVDDAARERFLAEIPAGRFAGPADIAGPVAFLCSERAAFINGTTLDVNGGWVMV